MTIGLDASKHKISNVKGNLTLCTLQTNQQNETIKRLKQTIVELTTNVTKLTADNDRLNHLSESWRSRIDQLLEKQETVTIRPIQPMTIRPTTIRPVTVRPRPFVPHDIDYSDYADYTDVIKHKTDKKITDLTSTEQKKTTTDIAPVTMDYDLWLKQWNERLDNEPLQLSKLMFGVYAGLIAFASSVVTSLIWFLACFKNCKKVCGCDDDSSVLDVSSRPGLFERFCACCKPKRNDTPVDNVPPIVPPPQTRHASGNSSDDDDDPPNPFK